MGRRYRKMSITLYSRIGGVRVRRSGNTLSSSVEIRGGEG